MDTLLSLYRAAGYDVPSVPVRRRTAQPVPRIRGAAYDSAGQGRRARGWQASTEGINSLLFANAEVLRNRSRDAIRKNPWAANALNSYTSNAIGTGVKPISLLQDRAIRKLIHDEWRRWTDESDFNGVTDFYGQQSLAFRSMLEAGEVLIRLHIVDDRDLRIPLQLQVLEADHLPFTTLHKPTSAGSNDVRSGIEVDASGRHVAYHLYREHPGETRFFTSGGAELVRVPANEIIHMFQPLRPSQLRGQPFLTQVLVTLYELDQYTDAALLRKKISTLLAGFIRKTEQQSEILPEGTRSETDSSIAEVELEPATLVNLLPGEEISWSDPPDESDFESFVRSHLRAIAAGIGITYEMLTGDLTGVNYSSIRAGLLEFRRKCEMLQHDVVVYQMCRPIFREWMKVAVLAGVFNSRDYSARRREYEDVRWMPPGWDWVDPLKDITAKATEIREGLASRAGALAAKGEDIETIDEENDADERRFPGGPSYGEENEEAAAQRRARSTALLNADDEEKRKEVVQ